MYKVFFCLTLLLAMGCDFIVDSGPTSGNTPDEVFQYIIAKSIPKTVSNLEGCGDSWQGYSFYLRFQAEPVFIEELLSQGYEQIEWNQISSKFNLPDKKYDVFEPSWKPEKVDIKECYIQNEVRNKWTYLGTHYLLIDRGNSMVYFYGVGG